MENYKSNCTRIEYKYSSHLYRKEEAEAKGVQSIIGPATDEPPLFPTAKFFVQYCENSEWILLNCCTICKAPNTVIMKQGRLYYYSNIVYLVSL